MHAPIHSVLWMDGAGSPSCDIWWTTASLCGKSLMYSTPCLCSDSIDMCFGWRNSQISLLRGCEKWKSWHGFSLTHSIVLHFTVYLTSRQGPRPHLFLLSVWIFIEILHQPDCLPTCVLHLRKCKFITHARYLSYVHILLLSLSLPQFLQLSQLTAAMFLFSLAGKHADKLNIVSFYMHGGIWYQTHTWDNSH